MRAFVRLELSSFIGVFGIGMQKVWRLICIFYPPKSEVVVFMYVYWCAVWIIASVEFILLW